MSKPPVMTQDNTENQQPLHYKKPHHRRKLYSSELGKLSPKGEARIPGTDLPRPPLILQA
jgi:hypothetical protein